MANLSKRLQWAVRYLGINPDKIELLRAVLSDSWSRGYDAGYLAAKPHDDGDETPNPFERGEGR